VPDPTDMSTPRPAAVCVYGDMVAVAKDALGDSGVNVAAVATAFPSGRASMPVKLADTRDAVEAGADEIDMVIDRGAFLSRRLPHRLRRDRGQVKEACGSAERLKVIMETGELDLRQRPPRLLAVDARRRRLHQDEHRQDLPRRDLPVTLVMLEAVRDWREPPVRWSA
jgi:deoxyribose-phosphate aldolase